MRKHLGYFRHRPVNSLVYCELSLNPFEYGIAVDGSITTQYTHPFYRTLKAKDIGQAKQA